MSDILPRSEMTALNDLYSELDLQIDGLKLATGLRCAPGCGACCLRATKELEVTVLEFLPVAFQLWTEGQAAEVLQQAQAAGEESPCVFYERSPDNPREGQCSRYAFRPLVCRLFGFSGVRDKTGTLKLTYSKVMKQADPDMVSQTQEILQTRDLVPAAADYGQRVRQLHPVLSADLLPLNVALVKALEWVLLRTKWHHSG